jgi:hypothetical protein
MTELGEGRVRSEKLGAHLRRGWHVSREEIKAAATVLLGSREYNRSFGTASAF